MRLLPLLLSLLLLLPSVACHEGSGPSLYDDDDPFVGEGGGADGYGLEPRYGVADYSARLEPRILNAELVTQTFGRERTLAEGARVVVLRHLSFRGVPTYVAAEDHTFELFMVDAESLDGATREVTEEERREFRYLSALDRTRNSVLCHMHPVMATRAPEATTRFTVTVDMCQSRREWEGDFYQRLVDLGRELGAPQAVGVALTGLWAHRHPEDFDRLVAWQNEGALDITWINHSFHHQLSRDEDGRYWFLTSSNVDLGAEVLELEILLLQQGVMFSPLFRFPGLTHDERTLAELNELGLFPLDADGWVAKGEPIEDGTVVLLHGNGNEAHGIEMFFDWFDPRAEDVREGRLSLLDPLAVLPLPDAEGAAPDPEVFSPCAP